MSKKLVFLCLSFYVVTLLSKTSQAEGVRLLAFKDFGDYIEESLSSFKNFSSSFWDWDWNPFRSNPNESSLINEDGFDLIDLNEFKNVTDKRHYGCKCENYVCYCCANVEIPKLHLNNTACVNLTYISEDVGLSLTFDLDGRVLYNNTVSVRNPPPLCFGIPHLEEEGSLCLKFYDLDAHKTKLHGCVDVVGKLADVELIKIKLGCFNFGNSTKFISESFLLYD